MKTVFNFEEITEEKSWFGTPGKSLKYRFTITDKYIHIYIILECDSYISFLEPIINDKEFVIRPIYNKYLTEKSKQFLYRVLKIKAFW